MEAAIIYSFGIATPSSVIPAFVRKGDLLLYDDAIHFTTAVGVKLARGTAHAFPHNDMSALETMLARHAKAEKSLPAAKRSRRFLLVEGLYHNGGGLCPLPELVRLRDTYGCYLIVDESLSIGTLGRTGRGVAEHYDMKPAAIDVIIGTMETALASVGGFCAGPDWVCAHQRLAGSGYCFSASLPAYATTAAMAALDVLASEPERVARLHDASATLASSLATEFKEVKHVQVMTHPDAPLAHISLTSAAAGVLSGKEVEQMLRDVCAASAATEGGAAVQLMLHSSLAHIQAPRAPTIRLTVNSETSPAALGAAVKALGVAMREALDRRASALRLVTVDAEIDFLMDGEPAAKDAANLKTLPSFSVLDASNRDDSVRDAVPSARPRAQTGSDESDNVVTVPVLFFLEYIRQISRSYVLRQMEWHAFSVAPQIAALRASRSAPLHALLTIGHFLGSEYFYFSVVPILCWSLGSNAHGFEPAILVAYFSLNVYVGNWLKNCFALARPSEALSTGSVSGGDDRSDFGWPSMYALNAVGLPFFALRSAFGAFGSGTAYSSEHQLLTAACYTGGILWVLLVCGARLYSGVSSPADVQGGMLVGGVLVRVWLPICEDVNTFLNDTPDALQMPQWAFLALLAILLLLIHPFSPGDARSWTAIAYSAKAIAFAATFIAGSKACGNHEWCAASRSSWEPSYSLASAAGLLVRCTVGFALLGVGAMGASSVSSIVEGQLRQTLPTKPCAPPIARNLAVFAVLGAMVSVGVPAALTAAGL